MDQPGTSDSEDSLEEEEGPSVASPQQTAAKQRGDEILVFPDLQLRENAEPLQPSNWEFQRVSKNETCRSSMNLQHFLHYSLLPSIAIIIVLSWLEKRHRRKPMDEQQPLLRRQCGIVIPLDFVGGYHNRWSMAFAFGTTANKVMILFSEGYLPVQVPSWARAFVILVCAMEVGLSSYPFFACLSTQFQITGAMLGFLYTVSWFTIIALNTAQCPHGQVMGEYEDVIFYWPSLLCLVFLLGRFIHILVKASWVCLRLGLPSEEMPFLEIHQVRYVQQLMRKPPKLQPLKPWIQRKVYIWDPYFRFPSRMICMAGLAIICLYMFVVLEFYVKKQMLSALEESFEMLEAARNTSEALASPVQYLKEFIDVVEDVWIVSTVTACLTSVSYVLHILACYRKHMKRLWAGKKQFLPLSSCKISHSAAAIARYSGSQIAYLLWGYLIVHIVQFLFGVILVYSFVLPIKHGQGIEVVKTLGTGILTIGIVVGLMVLQIVVATRFFLQPKIFLDDKEKPLALDNRKAFHNFNYFFFFYNVLLGLSACLFRLLCSVVVGTWLIARIDRTIMPRGYEAADMGFKTWIGMLLMDHYHTNPSLVCFCYILVAQIRVRHQQKATSYHCFNNDTDFRVSKKAKIRWQLLYTLLNNPSLSTFRKPK
ncbi:stimulated by retinoic acid gene 6 protein-like [Heteronotia binoei]|uniref:stimulated by retinoic acid gene 6 protein-like n=1 Tax=Heteronotia binoei TaxID=13085 RepID=UPI00292F082E|nr:stimulated by retinoic acid gene 6 protein-like [Heteronotia binoei]